MGKKLIKLEALLKCKLLEIIQTKSVYGGSLSYDISQTSDESNNYDSSVTHDTSDTGDHSEFANSPCI